MEKLRRRYQGRGKEGRARLLDEICEDYGYERKYAIKLLGAAMETSAPIKRSPPGPEPKYEPVSEVIAQIWKASEQLCGKRLVWALPLWLPHYERHFGKLLPKEKEFNLTQRIEKVINSRCHFPVRQRDHDVFPELRTTDLYRNAILFP